MKGVNPIFKAAQNISNFGARNMHPPKLNLTRALSTSENFLQELKTLTVTTPKPFVFHVELNRPKNYNAINKVMWLEIGECFQNLAENPNCRTIVLSASGKHFCAGIDLMDMMNLGTDLAGTEDVARKGKILESLIKIYQDSISSLEICRKPIIAAIHSACVGAGVDLITAADIRLCSEDSWFQIKEVDIGMAADVGSLQRFPKTIGNQGKARELCLTGRKFHSAEAKSMGFVNEVFSTKEKLLDSALKLAENIAEKSPLAVQNTKQNIVYSLDHTNQEGLDHIRMLNIYSLQSEDFLNAVSAQISKGDKPVFSKL